MRYHLLSSILRGTTSLLATSLISPATAATIFSESFGNLADGTPVSAENTSFTYVRTGSGGGGITISNPLNLANGASLLLEGPSNTSLNGIGVANSLSLGASTVLSLDFSFRLLTGAGQLLVGLGDGTSFTGNSTFTSSHGLFWFQIQGTTLQRRTSSSWVDLQTDLELDSIYQFSVTADLATDTLSVWLNGSELASDVEVTNPAIDNPTGFRIYAVNGASAVIDDIFITTATVPEPGTVLLGAVGSILFLRRRRR